MTPPNGVPQPSEPPRYPSQPPQPPYAPVPSQTPTLPPAEVATTTISPALLAQAVRQVEKEQSRRRWGRRAVLGVVAVGACCAVAEATPFAIRQVGLYTKQQLDDALQAGIQQGREQVLAELRNLEGIALTDAITVADLTRRGISNYVKPLADLAATGTGDALGAMAAVVGFARDHVPNATVLGLNAHNALANLAQKLSLWSQAAASDPLGNYAVQDVTIAEAYLKKLQSTINGSGSNATPTAGS